MFYKGTKALVVDNSGGRQVLCIHVFNKTTYGRIGDIILVSVKSLRRLIKKKRVKRNQLYLAVIVSTVKPLERSNGISINSNVNSVVLLTKEKNIIGKRVRGCVCYEVRNRGFSRLLSIAEGIV